MRCWFSPEREPSLNRDGSLASHTNAVSFWGLLLAALAAAVLPGTLVARAGRLGWPAAIAVGPALTYGVVGLAIIPFGALGIGWNALTALLTLAAVTAVAAAGPALRARLRRTPATAPYPAERRSSLGPALLAGAGVLLGAALIAWAAYRGIPGWQQIPSTWDSVWHANTIRYILDTGDASSLHMGELRNTDTHAPLYYPSAFHALAAVLAQLTGAAPTTAYTISALAAAVWLFPAGAATLAWWLLRPRTTAWRAAGAAATAGALAASFTALPYVEFDVAAMPNLVAYGLAIPTTVLVMSCLSDRRRIPLAVLAVIGLFSVHLTGGVVMVTFLAAWWCCQILWRPVRGRLADVGTLAAVAVPSLLVLAPQLLSVLDQAEVIAGHSFVSHLGRKRALFNAVFLHTRHLNDWPIQNALIALAAAGAVVLIVRRVWWPLAVWLLLIVAIVHSAAPFGGPIGVVIARYSDLFYSDPRRLSAVVTLLAAPIAGIGLFTAVLLAVAGLRLAVRRRADPGRRFWISTTAAILVLSTVGLAVHYFPRNSYLLGQKYDAAMVKPADLAAFAWLAGQPGARDTLIGNANTDGTAWMYAVAGLHPLWTHYDYPVQQGPGWNRFVIWAYADDADHDARVARAVQKLGIRYLLLNDTVVRGFVMPDGLVSLDRSASWAKIYDNGHARIYEWRGGAPQP